MATLTARGLQRTLLRDTSTRISVQLASVLEVGTKTHHLQLQNQIQRYSSSNKTLSKQQQHLRGLVHNQLSHNYIHPISQIVLLYLQNNCHEWICTHGLDQSLQLQADGTFVIQAPLPTKKEGHRVRIPRIWTYFEDKEKKHYLAYSFIVAADIENKEIEFPQHSRFLLQDNTLTAWQANRGKTLTQRVEESVMELMELVNRDVLRTSRS